VRGRLRLSSSPAAGAFPGGCRTDSSVGGVRAVAWLLAVLALGLAASGLLPGRAAAATQINLVSGGGSGGLGSGDPATTYFIQGVSSSFQPAVIPCQNGGWGLIAGTRWAATGSNCTSDNAGSNRTTLYDTQFTIPAGSAAPSISVTFLADNWGAVYLNGNLIGSQPATDDAAHYGGAPTTVTSSNPAFFQTGQNTLEIRVTDFGGPNGVDYTASVQYTGPTVWYRLGEASGTGMIDTGGAGHNGYCVNGVVTGASGALAGDPNTARVFDGRAAYCYANGITAPTNAYTIEGWEKLSTLASGTIVDHGGSGALFVTPTSFCFRQTTSPGTNICSAQSPGVGVWHHVVGTWSSVEHTSRLYVDGVLVAAGTSTAQPSGASTFYVGYGQSAPWFTGTLDEILYYPIVLTPAQIAAQYHAGCGC